jgi:hypothetical protein
MADLDSAEIDPHIRALGHDADAVGCVCTNMRIGTDWFIGSSAKQPVVIDSARQCLLPFI